MTPRRAARRWDRPITDGEARRDQSQASLEAENAAEREVGVAAVEMREGEREQGQAGAAQQQGQPLPARHRVPEEALRHHGQSDGAGGEHRLHEGDRRHREGGDVDQPGERGEPPAGGEPPRAGQATGAVERSPDVDGRDTLTPAVLEEGGEGDVAVEIRVADRL